MKGMVNGRSFDIDVGDKALSRVITRFPNVVDEW
jgi:hypothetical protein